MSPARHGRLKAWLPLLLSLAIPPWLKLPALLGTIGSDPICFTAVVGDTSHGRGGFPWIYRRRVNHWGFAWIC